MRVELLVPIEAPELQDQLVDTLDLCMEDDVNSWELGPDRQWTRRTGNSRSVHRELIARSS
jgi:hypothetical protein